MQKEQNPASQLSMEQELAKQLREGPMALSDKEKRAKASPSPAYEVRIQTVRDPIVEETRRFRQLAQEIDDRYDRYLQRAALRQPQNVEHRKESKP